MNLADLPAEERAAIEADKIACFVRHRCRQMRGPERQACAREIIERHPPEQQERIKAALTRRAGK